jgi:hypothetical protein
MGTGVGVGSGVAAGAQAYKSNPNKIAKPVMISQYSLGGPGLFLKFFMCVLLSSQNGVNCSRAHTGIPSLLKISQ